MTLWRNEQFRANDESAVLERTDISAEFFGVTTGRDPNQNVTVVRTGQARPQPSDPPGRPRPANAEEGSDSAANDNLDVVAPAVRQELGFSRDLVDTYFRQMGDAELLSREGEIALAKRIEAAQAAVVQGLCRVPMLIERINEWNDAWREGRLRLDQLIDASMSDVEVPGEPGAAFGGEKADPGEADAAPGEDQDSTSAGAVDARFAPAVLAQLEQVTGTAAEIGDLR